MKSLLIVDDDPDILESLAAVFEGTHAVILASNGREALAHLAQRPVDLVLLDLMMPVMDGATFMRELRKTSVRVPVILVSADPRVQDIARELGAVACLQKPVELEPLERTVAGVLAQGPMLRRA